MDTSLVGSTAEMDDNERPHANYVSNFYTALDVIKRTSPARSHDIMEIFGGKAGVTRIATRYRLRTGPNFDLVSGIDLSDAQEINTLWQYLYTYKPRFVVAGPPCTALGGWSHYNRVHHPETWEAKYKVGKALGELVAQIAHFQISQGRHFVIENPISSDLWSFPSYQSLMERPNVTFVRCDQCCYGLRDPAGEYTLKPTGFLCSHFLLTQRLQRRCNGLHQHVALAGKVNGVSRCSFAQVWPESLCQSVVNGILDVMLSLIHI